jgi:hypothetical protein
MSWDGLYCRDREYHEFEKGDEVYTVKKYGGLIKRKGYIVIDCKSQYKHLPHSNTRVITLMNEMGFECKYATYRFKKTDRQLRDDKLKTILIT